MASQTVTRDDAPTPPNPESLSDRVETLSRVSEQQWALTRTLLNSEFDGFSQEVRAGVLWLVADLADEIRRQVVVLESAALRLDVATPREADHG